MAQYQCPDTLTKALAQLDDNPDETIVMAGGTTIVPFLRSGDEETVLLDISRISQLKTVSVGTEIIIGSTVTLTELLGFVAEHVQNPVLRALGDVAGRIADPIMRNQATVGGNVARGGELASMLLALDGDAIFTSASGGTRRIRLAECLAEEGVTALGQPNELLTAVVARDQPYQYVYYDKFTRSHLASIPLASIAVTETNTGEIRVVLGSHRLFPERLNHVERRIRDLGYDLPLKGGTDRVMSAALGPLALSDDAFQMRIIYVLIERALRGENPKPALEVTCP